MHQRKPTPKAAVNNSTQTSPVEDTLDIMVPVYNEPAHGVSETLRRVCATFPVNLNDHVTIIVIDDGSQPPVPNEILLIDPRIQLLRKNVNRGYGAALKSGSRHGRGAWLAIIDADGTYPVEDLAEMWKKRAGQDMVVGVRTGDIVKIPLLRVLPKLFLNRFASYMAHSRIVDLNSGMRLFKRELVAYLWSLFPDGFSFTSTLTMGSLLGGYDVLDHPINYYDRVGRSSIHPIKDTIRFFKIVMRLGVLFSPFKLFGPMALTFLTCGFLKAACHDYPLNGYIGNLAISLMICGVQVWMMGVIGEMIVHSRNLGR
jgi:glycosyltransferase involved in cell wall biosynthesis